MKKYLIVEYGHKQVVAVFSDEKEGRKGRWYHPNVEIRVITNGIKLDDNLRTEVSQAIMTALYENGYKVADLSYEKSNRKRKSKISERQLALW